MRPDYRSPWEWSVHYYGLIEEGMRQTDCLMVCVAHQGRHPYLPALDGCHELPRPLDLRERVRLANLDRLDPSPDPARVEIDQDALAAGIAGALYELMERKRGQRAQNGRSAPPEPTSAQHEPSGASNGDTPHRVRLD